MAAEGEGKDKAATIIVNGRERTVTEKELTFDQVVDLAFEDPGRGPMIEFTISFRRGHGDKPEGTLVEGETLKVKDGMIVNVTRTDKS